MRSPGTAAHRVGARGHSAARQRDQVSHANRCGDKRDDTRRIARAMAPTIRSGQNRLAFGRQIA